MTKKSKFIERAEERIKRKTWLKYSSNIARRILAAIESKEGFNQVSLANLLEVSPQQVSKIVKGKENLTLETIANIATALDTVLITFPNYADSYIELQPISFSNYNKVIKLNPFHLEFEENNTISKTTGKKEQGDLTIIRGNLATSKTG